MTPPPQHTPVERPRLQGQKDFYHDRVLFHSERAGAAKWQPIWSAVGLFENKYKTRQTHEKMAGNSKPSRDEKFLYVGIKSFI